MNLSDRRSFTEVTILSVCRKPAKLNKGKWNYLPRRHLFSHHQQLCRRPATEQNPAFIYSQHNNSKHTTPVKYPSTMEGHYEGSVLISLMKLL